MEGKFYVWDHIKFSLPSYRGEILCRPHKIFPPWEGKGCVTTHIKFPLHGRSKMSFCVTISYAVSIQSWILQGGNWLEPEGTVTQRTILQILTAQDTCSANLDNHQPLRFTAKVVLKVSVAHPARAPAWVQFTECCLDISLLCPSNMS